MVWTYFSPELTLKEMELVENKDEEYMRSFKLLNNADVNETEMRLSSSTSKYVSAYCRRKTIEIDSKYLNMISDIDQESNSFNKEMATPTMQVSTYIRIQNLLLYQSQKLQFRNVF